MCTKSKWQGLLSLCGLLMLMNCQRATVVENVSLSARTLADEYERSTSIVRRMYDGKPITVRGYTPVAATMPQPGNDQGWILLEEKESKPVRQIVCWFSKDQTEPFSKIKGEQYITVRGIFNGEAGAELKFCKLVDIEKG
jgi:tRNA_anti-like